MVMKLTTAIDRKELARICLEEVRLWPGCEMTGVLSVPPYRFKLRVIEYGTASTKLADPALRAIEREKLRAYHLKPS